MTDASDFGEWSPMDWKEVDGDSDAVGDIKAMRDALRDQEPNFGINPATEFPTHVLRHACGHVVGYYRVYLPERYREHLRGLDCPTCRA